MAIRTITWTVDDALQLSPKAQQYAGVQGENNATEVVFALPAMLQEGYTLYLEFIGAYGAYDKTEALTVQEEAVRFPLPKAWTQEGGYATIRLVAIRADDATTGYSFAGRVRFDDNTVFGRVKSILDGGIHKLMELVQGSTEQAAASAQAAAGSADLAKMYSGMANSSAQEADDLAQTAQNGAYKAEASEAAAAQSAEAAAASEATAGASKAAAEQSAEAAAGSAQAAAASEDKARRYANDATNAAIDIIGNYMPQVRQDAQAAAASEAAATQGAAEAKESETNAQTHAEAAAASAQQAADALSDVGDVAAALDAILAMQQALIGGGTE